MSPNDRRNLERVVAFASDLEKMIAERGLTPEQIQSDQFIQWAVTTPLYNVGEYVSHISKELKGKHPEIPWSKVAGLRHRLVHDYEGTNWRIVIQVIFVDLPAFSCQVAALLAEEPEAGSEA